MADPNTRQGKRTPVTLKIKFKSETLEQFIERYAVDVSQGGIFIRTKEPLPVGTQMKFEFQLRDASPLIAGEGTVVWTRENDPSRPAIAPGMGVRFDRLNEGSQSVLERILAEKARQAPQRGASDQPTKPPLFTDVPTKVAPVPVQEALLGQKSNRTRQDSEQTPLPKPMPFHSDADDFDEKAFEEATKVRAVDELVAATANETPVDELANRRATVRGGDTASDAADGDSAPILPNPPVVEASRPNRLLDTTPSPRSAAPSTPPTQRPSQPRPSQAPPMAGDPAWTRGEPAARVEPTEKVAAPRAISEESSLPNAPSRPSSAPIVIGILLLLAAAGAGVWFFVLRDQVSDDGRKAHTGSATGSGSAVQVATPGSGSAKPMTGVTGSGGSAEPVKPPPPPAPTVETVVSSNVPATVTVEGSDQTGQAPFTAKLEKDKPYKVKVSAPGFLAQELELQGGQGKAAAKLVAKPRVIAVSSDPQGAQIWIDNVATGKQTPAEIPLSPAQGSKPKIHVLLRKAGFRPTDQLVEAAGFVEDDARMTATIDAKLAVMVMINTNPRPPNPGTGSGSKPAGTGSGSKPAGSGSEGSAASGSGTTQETPPPPPPLPPPAGSGGGSSGGGSSGDSLP